MQANTTPGAPAPTVDGYPTDLDGLIAHATALREQHGNLPLGLSPSGTWLSTLRLSIGRLGRGGGARKLVSRGGDPILVISGR